MNSSLRIDLILIKLTKSHPSVFNQCMSVEFCLMNERFERISVEKELIIAT